MRLKETAMCLAISTFIFSFALSPCFGLGGYDYSDNVAPSTSPPGGLLPSQVPMFVTLGFDDNAYSGLVDVEPGMDEGMTWATNFLRTKRNPPGTGNPLTFDGSPSRVSFYFSSVFVAPLHREDPALVKKSWRAAVDDGHEIGNHTHMHAHDTQRTRSLADWKTEIQTCNAWLTKPFDPNEPSGGDATKGIGVSTAQIFGFRAPFLEYNDSTFQVLKDKGFWYDCSIEEGWQSHQDGRNFYWPYTLNNGSPGDRHTAPWGNRTPIGNHPGLWLMPAHVVIVPPDDYLRRNFEKYGVKPGLRARLGAMTPWHDVVNDGKITGFDWNMWYLYGMTKAEFVATLKYTFDLRYYHGNRAPMMLGAHTDIFSSRRTHPHTTVRERQEAIEEFIAYVLTKPDVRVVPMKKILDWCRNPVALGGVTTGEKLP